MAVFKAGSVLHKPMNTACMFYPRHVQILHIPDLPVTDDMVVVMTTTGEAVFEPVIVGFGRILLVVDGTPCVMIFIPANKKQSE